MHVTDDDVAPALSQAQRSVGAPAAPEQGAVGAGTGMCRFGWKGGIGTSSRVLPDGHVVGVAAADELRAVRPADRRRRPGR